MNLQPIARGRPHWRVIAVVIVFAFTGWSKAPAVEVGGVYENLGTVVSAEGATGGGPVTLRGLFALEFDLALGRTLYADTDRVELTQLNSLFRIECKDADGARTWSGQWKINEGYTRTEEQVNLIFRSERFGQDAVRVVLRPVSDRNMLCVEMRHITSTWFGPVEKPIGTFLFTRLPTGAAAPPR